MRSELISKRVPAVGPERRYPLSRLYSVFPFADRMTPVVMLSPLMRDLPEPARSAKVTITVEGDVRAGQLDAVGGQSQPAGAAVVLGGQGNVVHRLGQLGILPRQVFCRDFEPVHIGRDLQQLALQVGVLLLIHGGSAVPAGVSGGFQRHRLPEMVRCITGIRSALP